MTNEEMRKIIIQKVCALRRELNIIPTPGKKAYTFLPLWVLRYNSALHDHFTALLFEQLVPTSEGTGEWDKLCDEDVVMGVYSIVVLDNLMLGSY